MARKGYLVLENGMHFEGAYGGFEGETLGEVVFSTGMMGYPESFTDPSFRGQILTLTYPLVGNYGVPEWESLTNGIRDSFESDAIHIQGLIVSSLLDSTAHWQAVMTLDAWLKKNRIPALSGIDTRTLTKILREKGTMRGAIVSEYPPKRRISFSDGVTDNLIAQVSCTSPQEYHGGPINMVMLDCGMKTNQVRLMTNHGFTIYRVPWDYPIFEEKGPWQKFDVLFISNGPGDPKDAAPTINTIKEAMSRKIPILGICLGHQLLGLASGANTYKLPYGHRGQNQPVREEGTTNCYVTTQNHGYAVDVKTMQSGWKPWFTNLNDGTNEGMKHDTMPWMSVQFHPESMPGPTDTEWIFDYFRKQVQEWRKK